MEPTSPEKQEQAAPPLKSEPGLLDQGPSPFRPSPEQRRWAYLPVALVLAVIVLVLLLWYAFFR